MNNINTGLNDKNGNRIKAGDIIKLENGDKSKVFYNPKKAGFYQEIIDYAYPSILRIGEQYPLIGEFTTILDMKFLNVLSMKLLKKNKSNQII